MRSWVVKSGVFVLSATVLAGCGSSSSSKPTNKVAQVRLSPASLSIVAGDVAQISPTALNSSNGTVATTFTFNSSNTALATISPGGLVCGGTWDSSFITCKGTDSSGNPLAGSAIITATAEGVSSAPLPVAVHPSVTSIQVTQTSGNLFPGCTSNQKTAQFQAKAFHNATDITSLVGEFTWTPSGGTVASIDANGLATVLAPGLTGIIASLGSTTSPAVNFKGCLPVQIRLHVNNDTATSATLNVNDTKTIQADTVDENNVTTNSAPGITIVSNNSQVASVAALTLTGVSPGGAGLVAVCAPPNCGVGLNTPMYSNLFQVTVNGSSPATTVYATTTFTPPTGTTPTMIPIDTSKTPPAAGTAINLPGVPNSLVFIRSGAKGYMGTSAGLATLDTGTNAATLLHPFVGKVLAVSPDGSIVIESNAADAPDPTTGTVHPVETRLDHQRLVIINVAGNSVQTFVLPGAVAAAFTSDGSKAFIAVRCLPSNPCPNGGGNVYVLSTFQTLQTLPNIGAASDANIDVATLASGPFAYFAHTAGLEVMGTCNNAPQGILPATNSAAIQLVGSVNNADMVVAVDSPGVDVETVTVTPITPTNITTTNCTPNVAYSNQFIDFGVGAFTARQLLVPSNNSAHIVVLPVGISKLLVAVPGGSGTSVDLAAGATEALSGSLTLDGNTAWVGVAGTNNVDRVDLAAGSDNLQIATSFKKSDSSAAPPNLVAVKPK